MPFHNAKPGHEPDDGHALRYAQLGVKGAAVHGSEALAVGPAGQRHHAIRRGEPGPDALPPYRLADRDHEIGGTRIQPAIQGVRANGLHNVTSTDQRPWGRPPAIGQRGQPVLLAPVDVDDVDAGQAAGEGAEVAGVRARTEPGAEGHGLDARDAFRARPGHDALFAPRGADQRRFVPGPLQLPAHLRRPVDVGGPAPTRDEMDDLHEERARRARASR